jgi:hypothetical protein
VFSLYNKFFVHFFCKHACIYKKKISVFWFFYENHLIRYWRVLCKIKSQLIIYINLIKVYQIHSYLCHLYSQYLLYQTCECCIKMLICTVSCHPKKLLHKVPTHLRKWIFWQLWLTCHALPTFHIRLNVRIHFVIQLHLRLYVVANNVSPVTSYDGNFLDNASTYTVVPRNDYSCAPSVGLKLDNS